MDQTRGLIFRSSALWTKRIAARPFRFTFSLRVSYGGRLQPNADGTTLADEHHLDMRDPKARALSPPGSIALRRPEALQTSSISSRAAAPRCRGPLYRPGEGSLPPQCRAAARSFIV